MESIHNMIVGHQARHNRHITNVVATSVSLKIVRPRLKVCSPKNFIISLLFCAGSLNIVFGLNLSGEEKRFIFVDFSERGKEVGIFVQNLLKGI